VLPGNHVTTDTVEGTIQSAGNDYRVGYDRVPQSFSHNTLSHLFGIGAGYYALRKRGIDSFTVVDTIAKEYFREDFAALLRSHSPAFSRELEGTDTVFAERVLPDSVIDGYRTEHWRLTDVHTMDVAGRQVTRSSVHSVTDSFIVPEFASDTDETSDNLLPGQPIIAGARYGVVLHAAEHQIPRGLRLLVFRRDEVGMRNGAQFRVALITRRSNVRRVEFPASEFEVPSGYRRVEAPTAR
jgi:hypothetical protein